MFLKMIFFAENSLQYLFVVLSVFGHISDAFLSHSLMIELTRVNLIKKIEEINKTKTK